MYTKCYTCTLYSTSLFFLSKYGTTNITNKAHPIANKKPKFSNLFTPYFVYNINTIILQKYS